MERCTFLRKHLWGNVWQAATDPRRTKPDFIHVLATLSTSRTQTRMDAAEHLRDTKVGNLDMPLIRKEQVLQLDVTMGDAILVKIRNAPDDLLEEAHLIVVLEVITLDKREQLPVGAVFHHVVPTPIAGAEAIRLDDVRVFQAVGNAELGLDFLFVFSRALVLGHFAELLDRIPRIFVAFPVHDAHGGGCSFTNLLSPSAWNDTGAHKLFA